MKFKLLTSVLSVCLLSSSAFAFEDVIGNSFDLNPTEEQVFGLARVVNGDIQFNYEASSGQLQFNSDGSVLCAGPCTIVTEGEGDIRIKDANEEVVGEYRFGNVGPKHDGFVETHCQMQNGNYYNNVHIEGIEAITNAGRDFFLVHLNINGEQSTVDNRTLNDTAVSNIFEYYKSDGKTLSICMVNDEVIAVAM